MSQLWLPNDVTAYVALQELEFINLLKSSEISIQPMSVRYFQKHSIEPKHGVIQSTFLRLHSSSHYVNSNLNTIQAVCISNYLYVFYAFSSSELVEVFTKPL